jgi:hypothetical protein
VCRLSEWNAFDAALIFRDISQKGSWVLPGVGPRCTMARLECHARLDFFNAPSEQPSHKYSTRQVNSQNRFSGIRFGVGRAGGGWRDTPSLLFQAAHSLGKATARSRAVSIAEALLLHVQRVRPILGRDEFISLLQCAATNLGVTISADALTSLFDSCSRSCSRALAVHCVQFRGRSLARTMPLR